MYYNQNSISQSQMHIINNRNYNPISLPIEGMPVRQYFNDNTFNNGYIEHSNYRQNQHLSQYPMMQVQQMNDRSLGRSRTQTRGPFSRTAASRSTTPPPPINRTKNSNSKELLQNDELNILRRSTELMEINKNPSLSHIENNCFNNDNYNLNNQDFSHTPINNKQEHRQLNIVNPDQIIVQKMNMPLEPTPTHVAKMNKMRLMGLNNVNSQLTPTSAAMNNQRIRDGNVISRQSSFPPQYYQDKYSTKTAQNSNNSAAVFRESSPKVLGSYVSRQLEEEVTRLRYLVDTQTKKISTLELKNKELENELASNRNYQQLYQELLEKTNLSEKKEEIDHQDNVELDNIVSAELEFTDDQIANSEEQLIQKSKASTKDIRLSKQNYEKNPLFSNIHQFSAESALRKAGVPPGKPSYIYRPPNNAELVDIKLAEFHNSRSSLIRWSKVSNSIYLFGTTQVQLRISRGNLLAKPESSEWGNGNFWPIEKFVSIFEPIERSKMPNN